MIKIKRRIEGKTDHHEIYAKDEALQKGLSFVPWKDAQVGEYAITDDGYVGLCYGRKNYTDKNGKLKTFIKLTCGVGWVTPFSRIDFLKNHEYRVYSKTNPTRKWDQEEAGKQRSKKTVTAYAQMLINDGKIDFETLGKIYRPEQKKPVATVRRFLKQKVVKEMVEEKLKEILSKKSISKEFAVDNIVIALKMAEEKGDVNNFLKANDYLMDLLEMKPNKKMITDTIQVDMTQQIADTIAKEDKRLTLQRKSEEHEARE